MKDEEKGSIKKNNLNYSEAPTSASISKTEKNSNFPKTFKEADEYYMRL